MKQNNDGKTTRNGNTPQVPDRYVEILGDTVLPVHVIFSIIISVVLGLGGFLAGQALFPKIAGESMVSSYSLLAGIAGCVLALILSAILFKPKRVLTETEITADDAQGILNDLQVNFEEEMDVIKHDPATRKEMEDLKIKDIFIPTDKGGSK